MIKTVYLDLDGVLVNFVKGVCNALDKHYRCSNRGWPTDYTFWNEWPDITFDAVNAACNTEFWSSLDWMHDGQDIQAIVARHFRLDQIYLVTQPMPNVESATGKWLWVKHNLPKYYSRMITAPAGVPKALLAKPDTLLIDDKDENIDEFILAGGQGLLVPRSWNRAYPNADRTLSIVENFLEDLDVS